MNSAEIRSKNPLKRLPIYVRIILVLVLLISPVAIVYVIFTPLNVKNASIQREKSLKTYAFNEDFSLDDLVRLVHQMKKEPEFMFYFIILNENEISIAAGGAFEILKRSWSKEALEQEILHLKEDVELLGRAFYYLDYPSDSAQNWDQYPELKDVMWSFITEEFQLAIIGLCYKASFDHDFSFKWNKTSLLAALKLEEMLKQMYMNPSQ